MARVAEALNCAVAPQVHTVAGQVIDLSASAHALKHRLRCSSVLILCCNACRCHRCVSDVVALPHCRCRQRWVQELSRFPRHLPCMSQPAHCNRCEQEPALRGHMEAHSPAAPVCRCQASPCLLSTQLVLDTCQQNLPNVEVVQAHEWAIELSCVACWQGGDRPCRCLVLVPSAYHGCCCGELVSHAAWCRAPAHCLSPPCPRADQTPVIVACSLRHALTCCALHRKCGVQVQTRHTWRAWLLACQALTPAAPTRTRVSFARRSSP